MFQIYFFTELFLFLSSAVILSDTWTTKFLFLANLRKFFYSTKKMRISVVVVSALLLVMNMVFPIAPGPFFLGDFVVGLDLFFLFSFFGIKFLKKNYDIDLNKKNDTLGYFTLGVFVLHLFFPQLVLI